MLTPDLLHAYQQKAVNFQATHPESMLWLDMGLGKTVITLTSIAHLIRTQYLRGVLIVAPIRVIRLVWKQEAAKWSHTGHLKFSMITGTRDQRTRALLRPADIYLLNYENLGWMAETLHTYFISKGKEIPFNGIVWDEVSKMKNSATQRVKSFKKVIDHFIWSTGLTGTPASNGYKDLHGQYLVVDKGVRLGTSKTAFRHRFYKKAGPYKEVPYEDTETTIKQLIGDITLEMSAEDYNPLPDLIVNDIEIELPSNLRDKYDQMEKEFFLLLDSGTEVEMFNQASLTNKCLAKGTEVLTFDGWKRIETLTDRDVVWDGVEWVSISGIVYNGYMPVVECWGVTMTPDHKLLTDHGWKECQEIIDGQPSGRFNRSRVRTPYSACEGGEQGNIWEVSASVVESPVCLWDGIGSTGSESIEQKTSKNKIVRLSSWGDYRHPQHDKDSPVDDMAKHAKSVQLTIRQRLGELRRAWNKGMPRMGHLIREVLGGHGSGVSAAPDNRAPRCKQGIRQGELSVGHSTQTGEQYPEQRVRSDTSGDYDTDAGCSQVQPETNHCLQEKAFGLVGCGDNKACVFDVINAGPRHRFTVRGRNGEVFIAHNCLQFSNGAMYPVPGMPLWEPIHELKLDALEEIIDEAQGSPVLCSYAYRSDAQRIMAKFKHLDPINLTDCKSEASLNNAMWRWKSGNCELMIGHPASMGHGIDGLQDNGHTVVWFGLNWSLDLYEQMNARVRRQGQGVPVVCHRILMRDTLDQAQALALDEKAQTQAGLRNAIKEYRKSRGQ